MRYFIPFLLSMLLIACSSDDDSGSSDDNNGGLGDTFITAKINGNDFEAIPIDRGVPTISAQLVDNGTFFSLTIAGIDLFENIRVLSLDDTAIIKSAEISADLKKKGMRIRI